MTQRGREKKRKSTFTHFSYIFSLSADKKEKEKRNGGLLSKVSFILKEKGKRRGGLNMSLPTFILETFTTKP